MWLYCFMAASEAWALSPMQLERLEVFVRGCLRAATPARVRRRYDYGRVPGEVLHRTFHLSSVATLLDRRQLRWLGHVARMDSLRLPLIILSARRMAEAGSGQGCGGASLLGARGGRGVYQQLLARHLDSRARRLCFDGSRCGWMELAQMREAWRRLVRSASR